MSAGRLTRVTLAGPRRRVDLAVPSDEPVGLLLPEIVALTAHRPGTDPAALCLTALGGRTLRPDATLREAGVLDGAVLRVEPRTEATPAAVVLDLSDEVSDDLESRPGRWGAGPRAAAATVVVVAAAAGAALLAPGPAVLALVGGAALAIVGATVGASGVRPLAPALVLAGIAAVMVRVPGVIDGPERVLVAAAAVVALGVAATGVATGRARAGIIGAAAALGQLGAWTGLTLAGMPADRAAALLALLTVALLGLLPRLVLGAAGLTGLDDRLVEGRPVPRGRALAAIDTAHRGLVPAVAATAASGAAAGVVLATGADAWGLGLAAVTGVVLVLRVRAYPLTAQVAVLGAAALVVAGALVARLGQEHAWVAALVVAAAGAAVLGRRPAAHVLARARRIADRVEGLAALAALPLAVGVFGVYTRLLEVF